MRLKLAVLFVLLAALFPALAQKEAHDTKKTRVEYRDVDAPLFVPPVITQESVVDYVCMVNPGNPPTGKIRVYCDSGTGLLTCLSSVGANVCPSGGGGGGSAVGTVGTVQGTDGAGNFTALGEVDNGTTLSVPRDSIFQGPSPYRDVRLFGVRSTGTSVTPFIPGITATISLASPTTATLSAASSFINGDGVTIWGAGNSCPLIAPTGVTVTPMISAAPTGTFIDVAAPSGSTSYAYEVIAVDKFGCYTAASSLATTSTGNTLGAQNLTISGFTQSGNIVTATVSSTATLSVGTFIYVTTVSGTDAATFAGQGFIVTSIPNGTTFTYNTMNTVAGGAPAVSQSGGTVYYWNSNKIAWSPVVGAYQYYVYGRTSGTLVPVCQSWINSPSFPVSSCDDYGATMMAGQVFPYWLPSTPPASPLPDPLTTTIVSGAGTTTLVLASPATTAVSGQTILFDNAPNILTAMGSGQGLLYFPPGTYVVNSHIVTPGLVIIELAQATLWLNATMEAPSRFFGMIGPQSADTTSFGWPTGGTIIGSHTSPAVWDTIGGNGFYEGIKFQDSGNGSIGLLVDASSGGAQNHYKNINFNGAGSNGYMDIPLVMRGGFWYDMDHVSINTGPGQAGGGFIGTTSTPGAYMNIGGVNLGFMSIQDRGIFHIPATAGADVTFHGENRAQGIITPVFSIYGQQGGGFTTGRVILSDIQVDTAFMASFGNVAGLNGSYTGTVSCDPTYSFAPGGGYAILTGAPVGFVYGSCGGQNFQSQYLYSFSNNPVSVTANGEFLYPIANTVAPTVAISSGGSVPVGNLSYVVTVLDVNGNESIVSPYVNFTTTSGNQTVTVTPPAAPAGAVSWRPYRCFANAASCTLADIGSCSSSLSFSSTYVDTFSFTCGSTTPTINRAGSQTLSAAGLSGTIFNFLGGGFKDAISGTFTANRVQSLQDVTDTFVYRNTTDTLANKTFTSLVLNGPMSGTGLQGTDTKVLSSGTVSGSGASLCTDANGGATTSGCPASASFYQTVQVAGSSKPQEAKLNFIAGTNMTVSCADNSGATSTDCTLTSSATGATAFSAITAATNSNSGTFAATGNTWDFTGATALKSPVASSFAPTVNGSFGYDSVANKWVFGQNGATVSYGLTSSACSAHNWVSTPATATATAICTQPAFTDISGTATTAQLPTNVVTAVTNDTNVTGSISAQTLTLGWTGTLAKARALATAVYTDQANSYSTGAQDFSFATSLKAPIGAGLVPTASGLVGYDSTANKFVFGQNGATVSFGLSSSACSTHQWVNTPATGTATASCGQPAFTDISGVATGAQLPNPSATTLGGVESFAAVAHQWINTISTSGVPSSAAIGTNDISPNQYAAGGGTAQAQTVTLSPAATALVAGLQVYWLPSNANTGAAPTLAPNGLTAKSITKFGNSTPLVANDLTTNAIAFAIYDGTEWQLQNPQTSTGGGSSITLQTNGVNNVTQTSLNFITSTTNAIGGTITPSNPSGSQEIFELTGRITPTGGGTGLSSPTAHSLLVTEGSSNFNLLTSPSTNGACVVFFNVTASAAVDPTCGYQGVPVNAQAGSYALLYTDRLSYVKESGASTSTLTLPQVTGTTASNFSFVTQNLNSGTETLTANAVDKIDGSAVGGSATLLPNFAAFVYQDSSSAPGNWWTLKLPTFAAFGSTCANVLSWSTSGGFTCVNASGSMFANFTAHQWLGNNTSSSAAPSPSLIGSSDTSPNWYAAATGTAQAQVVALTPAVTALTTGTEVHFLPVAANTAANPSLAVNGLAAKSITKFGGSTNLVANDLTTSAIAVVIYDGTQWELVNPQTSAGGGGTPCTTTGNSLQYDNAGAFGCVTPFTFSGSTITAASTGILDLSAESGASAFKIPVQAGATSASDGVVDYDSTAKITHIRTNAADSLAAATTSTTTTTTQALFATAVAGVYNPRAIASADLPLALQNGTTCVTQTAGDNTTDCATDAFVTTAISNAIAAVNPAVAVLVATTGSNLTGTYVQVGGGVGDTFTVTATGAFTLDGVALNTVGQRVLIKDQSTASQNGVYTVTVAGTTGVSPVFTRALDYDTPSDVNNTGSIPVQSGTANATTSWLLTSQVTSIGSSGSSLTYAQFSFSPTNIVTAAANFTSGDLVQAAASNKTTSDSGIAVANVVTATSAAAAAKQVCTSGGASKTCAYIDFPQVVTIPSANCVNSVAGSGWSLGASGVVTCRAGTNNTGGYVAITDTTGTFGQFSIPIPEDWDTGTLPYIRFQLAYPGTDGASAHTIIPQIKVSCAKGDGTTSDDVTFNAAHSSSTITLSSATANLFFVGSNVQMNSTDMTGCVAGSMMVVQVGRATDTATSAANFYSATITFPRLIAVQAN